VRYPCDVGQQVRLERCQVDLDTGEVSGLPEPIVLSPMERRLLAWLSAHPGEDVSRARLLEEVWDYAAAVSSRTVDTTIARLRQKLERDPARPDHLHTVRGVGYRFAPLLRAPPTAPAAPAAPATGCADRLPAPLTPFVGRAAELSRLDVLLAQRRLITLCGPGGVGKTRLALAAARRHTGRFSDLLFCSLAPRRGEDGIAASLSEALGLPGVRRPEVLQRALGERRRPLLVVDNAEHLLESLQPLLSGWLAALPALVVVVTSRQRLRLRGEALLQLAPMDPLDATALLSERYADATGTPPPDAAAPLLQQLAARLDHLPLAIELAAARMDLLSPTQVLAQLSDRFALLAADWADAEPRQATMWGALEWSWSRLSLPEQHALARCTLVQGGISPEAMDALVGAAPMPPGSPSAAALLAALRRKSLLQANGSGGILLDTVRDFAAQKAPQARSAAALGWARWLLAAAGAQRALLYRDTSLGALAWLRGARDDLVALWDRHKDDAPELAGQALIIIHPLLSADGALHASAARYKHAVTLALPRDVRAQLHIALAELSGWRHDGQALSHAHAALALADTPSLRIIARTAACRYAPDGADRLEDGEAILADAEAVGGWVRIQIQQLCAELARKRGDSDRAIALAADGVRRSREEGWPLHEAALCRVLGLLRSRAGDTEAAIRLLRHGVDVTEAQGDQSERGWMLNTLGIVHLERSQHPQAAACFQEALRVLQHIGASGTAAVMTNLAAIHHQERRLEQARALYRRALPEMHEGGRHFEIALTHANLGAVEVEADHLDAAERHLTTAIDTAEQIAASWVLSFACAVRASLRLIQGRLSEGRADAEAGQRHAQDARDLRMEAYNLVQLGPILALQGDLPAATGTLDEAIAKIIAQGDPTIRTLAHTRRAAVRQRSGDHAGAQQDLQHIEPKYSDGVLDVIRDGATPRTFEARVAALLWPR